MPGQLHLLEYGKYKIIEPLGRSGQGQVFKGKVLSKKKNLEEIRPGDTIAIKYLSDPRRDERIAKKILGFRHESVIKSYEFIEDKEIEGEGEKSFFWVMEYFEGEPLPIPILDRDYDLECILDIFIKICAGFEYIHSKNITHRDIKPANILVKLEAKEVRILDFSLSKPDEEEQSEKIEA